MPNVNIEIVSNCDKYKLVFLLNHDDKPTMGWIELTDTCEVWDSEDYLDRLLSIIDTYINDGVIYDSEFKYIIKYIPTVDFEVIQSLFNKAIDLGLWER